MATQSISRRAASLLAVLITASCSPDQLPTAPDASESRTPYTPTVTVVVCKFANDTPTRGQSFTFNTTASTTLGTVTPQVSMPAQAYPASLGDCRVVWSRTGIASDGQTRLTVAEVVPPGYDLTSVWFLPSGGPPIPAVQNPAGDRVTFVPHKGVIVVFNNSAVAPPPPPPAGGRIGDFAWRDLNSNGLQDAGEPGLAGVVVILRTTAGAIVATTTSGATGAYSFTGVAAGCYFAEVIPPSGFQFTTPDAGDDALDSDADPATASTPATCVFDSEDLTFDFGFVPNTAP
jgi:hypothetical protein